MDNQDSSTGCVVPHGGSSREPERSSDSSTLGLGLLFLLEPPPKLKLFPLKKLPLRLIALRLAGKVSSLQQKTEAGIRTSEYPINAIARKQGVFFLCHPVHGGSGGAPTRWPEIDGSGCSNSVWATTTEIRTSCGSNFNPSEPASMMLRTVYCCNPNPVFVSPEHHEPRPPYSQKLKDLLKKIKIAFWMGFLALVPLDPSTGKPWPMRLRRINEHRAKAMQALADGIIHHMHITTGIVHCSVDSDSSTLGSELSSLLESPPKLKLFPFKKSSLRLIALRLAGKVSSLQQKTEVGINTPKYPESLYTQYRRVFLCQLSTVVQAGHLRGDRNLWSGSVNPAWAATKLRLTPLGGSNFNPKRLPV